jgi:hypothetical protein
VFWTNGDRAVSSKGNSDVRLQSLRLLSLVLLSLVLNVTLVLLVDLQGTKWGNGIETGYLSCGKVTGTSRFIRWTVPGNKLG